MSKDASSPFTPGLPVPPEFFVGRLAEIERLRTKVATALDGRFQVVYLVGERGIGKSSLAYFVRLLAERDLQVAGLHVFLGGVTSLEETVRRMFDRLLKQSVDTPWHNKVKQFLGNHIRQVGLFGISVEFDAPEIELRRMVLDFGPTLQSLITRLSEDKKGILLILDDINGLSSSTDFANWLKSVIDEIGTTQKPLPVCLLLVGLEERRQELIERQPSLARVFDLIEIRPWSDEETRTFYQNAFSKVGVTVDEQAVGLLTGFTGGLPVLAHEIGEAVFKFDQDNRITMEEALEGIVIAADIVGRKLLEPQVFTAIRSPRYRAILRKLSKEPFAPLFRRGDVLKALPGEERKAFDNFLRRMAHLGVIARDVEKGVGAYRFPNLLHYLYFRLEAAGPK